MAALDEVGVEVGDAIEDFVECFEGGFVVAQALLPYIWWIANHSVEACVVFVVRLVEEDFGKF